MRLQPESEHPHGLSDAEFDSLFTTDKPVIFAYHGYPWLIHRLTYRRTNHANLHVRGYKEEGTTTTPFDMVMLNDLDRFHLVIDVIDRVPGLGPRAGHVRQQMVDQRLEAAPTRGARARTPRRSATGRGRLAADARRSRRRPAAGSSSSTPARAASSCGSSTPDDAVVASADLPAPAARRTRDAIAAAIADLGPVGRRRPPDRPRRDAVHRGPVRLDDGGRGEIRGR